MNEELDIKLWPVGDKNSYIEIKNPEFFLKNTYSSKFPVKVYTHKDETKESLEKVIEHVDSELFFKLNPLGGNLVLGNLGQVASTVFTDGLISYFGILNPSSPISSDGLYINFTSSPLVGAVSLASLAAITALSGIIYKKRNEGFTKRADRVAINSRTLRETDINSINVEKDDELVDIFSAIENNQPLEMVKPKDNDSYKSIKSILHGKFGSIIHGGERLPQRAREVYIQKEDAHRGRIARV